MGWRPAVTEAAIDQACTTSRQMVLCRLGFVSWTPRSVSGSR